MPIQKKCFKFVYAISANIFQHNIPMSKNAVVGFQRPPRFILLKKFNTSGGMSTSTKASCTVSIVASLHALHLLHLIMDLQQ